MTFDGDQLVAVILDGDGAALPVRAAAQALGLDPRYQLQRLREHDVLVTGLREVHMPVNGKLQIVVVILSRYLPFWLATITPARVDEAVRPKLVRYQTELVDVLNRLYGQELALQHAELATPKLRRSSAGWTNSSSSYASPASSCAMPRLESRWPAGCATCGSPVP